MMSKKENSHISIPPGPSLEALLAELKEISHWSVHTQGDCQGRIAMDSGGTDSVGEESLRANDIGKDRHEVIFIMTE